MKNDQGRALYSGAHSGFSRLSVALICVVTCALGTPRNALAQTGTFADDNARSRASELYRQGIELEIGRDAKRDFAAAAVRYGAAAALGHTGAQIRLGYLTQTGSGVPRDLARALSLYRAAADAGNAEGQYRVAIALLEGRGAPRDAAGARRHLARAANAEHQESQVMLAILQQAGTGGEKNAFSARRWFQRAESGPDSEVAQEAARVRKKLDEHLLDSDSRLGELIAGAIVIGAGIAVALAATAPERARRTSVSNDDYNDRERRRLERQRRCFMEAAGRTRTVVDVIMTDYLCSYR